MAYQYKHQELKEVSTTILDLNNLHFTQNMDIPDCLATRLPVEVVIYLMEFLPYSDRMAAAQTCRLWYEALRHPKFLNQEKVLVKKTMAGYLAAYAVPSRPYPHLVLVEVEISRKARDFWLATAPGLRSLYVSTCDLCERMFVDVISRCQQLESLTLNNCRELFMPGWCSLRDLISNIYLFSKLKYLALD